LNCQPNVGFRKIVPHTRNTGFKKNAKNNGQEHLADITKRGDKNKRQRSNGRLVKSLIKQFSRKEIANASQTYEGLKPTGRITGDSHKPRTHMLAVRKTATRGNSAADYREQPIIDRNDTSAKPQYRSSQKRK
jgi:hypothetical protein